jgi:hypothetical protein
MIAHPTVRFLAPIVVAAVLGPLVVSIGLSLFSIVSLVFDPAALADPRGAFAEFREGVVFLVLGAYFIGGPFAALAGLLVSLWMMRRPPSALVVNAAAVIATGIFISVATTGVFGLVEENNGRRNSMFVLVAAVFAANVCWLLTRRFTRPEPAPAS